MSKAAEAFRTISEVASDLDVPKHVLRFWEAKFPQIRPMKRGGGRRYYRPEDMALLRGIRHLLHAEGYTIKGVQKILREQGVDHVKAYGEKPVPVPADKGARRGARAMPSAKPAVEAARAPSAPAPVAIAKSAPPAPAKSEIAKVVEAGIAELKSCRRILAGDAPAAEPAASDSRKSEPQPSRPSARTRAARA